MNCVASQRHSRVSRLQSFSLGFEGSCSYYHGFDTSICLYPDGIGIWCLGRHTGWNKYASQTCYYRSSHQKGIFVRISGWIPSRAGVRALHHIPKAGTSPIAGVIKRHQSTLELKNQSCLPFQRSMAYLPNRVSSRCNRTWKASV